MGYIYQIMNWEGINNITLGGGYKIHINNLKLLIIMPSMKRGYINSQRKG